MPEETNGVRKAVEVGLEGGNPIVELLPGAVDVRSGGRPEAVEVVGEGPHEDPMGAIEGRERGVHKVVGCEVEAEGSERAAHAYTLLPEDNAEEGKTLIRVPQEGKGGEAIELVEELGALRPAEGDGLEDRLAPNLVESVDSVVGVNDAPSREDRLGRPGKSLRASLCSQTQLNRVNGGHGGLSGRGGRGVREGLLEEGGPTVDGAVLGGTPS